MFSCRGGFHAYPWALTLASPATGLLHVLVIDGSGWGCHCKTDWRIEGRAARAFNPVRNGSTSKAVIQVIPVGLFAGFTFFHRAGVSINNATHTGVCVPGTERNAWERNFPVTYESAD